MANFKPTPEQARAINDRDKDILVSASAGSGKTAVLVDRVIKLLKENRHLNIDEMLLVTFTKEAAKNMRDRIRQRLVADSNDVHMKAQINRLALANISTIHSFCEQVIKRYYYVIGLDPQYRLVTDETEQSLLRDQIWNELQEDRFKEEQKIADPSQWRFSQLSQNFADPKSNVGEGLQDVVMKLYREANAQPDPDQWLDNSIRNYQFGDLPITKTAFYRKTLMPILKRSLDQIIADWQALVVKAQDGAFDDVADLLSNDVKTVQKKRNILETADWDTLQSNINKNGLGKLKSHRFKDDPGRKQLYEDITKRGRNELKQRLDDLHEKYFQFDEQQMRSNTEKAFVVVSDLIDVTKDYRHRYREAKLGRHMLDFSDLEHYAYQILTDTSKDGQQVQDELRHQFKEILVDEYQDTNQLQDKLINQLHDPKLNHLFMVGDVKQSIYRFRQADPTLFLEKSCRYRDDDPSNESINLAENFRSMSNVTEFTNLIFSQLMDQELGEMNYDQAAQLKFAAKWYDPRKFRPVPTEVMIYDAGADDDQPGDDDSHYIKLPESSDKYEGEVWMIGMRIRQMLDHQEQIYDPSLGSQRPIKPADIVILERTKSPNNRIVEQFGQLDIPVTVHDVQNYFKATEVRTVISLLKVIDNPYQDIPLVAVLRSPIVGITEPEMALIKINDRYGSYFEAIQKFNQYDDDQAAQEYGVNLKMLHMKLLRFLNYLQQFSITAERQSLVDLIWQIYQETGYLDYVGGMPGGNQRQANLHALYQRAHSYEESSFKGLYQFIHFIERMQQKDEDLGEAPVQLATDSVNVMTIHGSKGLQFPIVFLIDTNHKFNNMDISSNVVVEPHQGIGISLVGAAPMKKDNQSLTAENIKVNYDLPQRTVIVDSLKRANRAEEMRLLYVALTRAEQRLIVTGSVNENNSRNNLKTLWEQWTRAFQSHKQVLGPQLRLESRSMLDWIGMTIIREPHFDPAVFDQSFDDIQGHYSGQLLPANFNVSVHTANQVEETLRKLKINRSNQIIEDEGSIPLTADQREFINRVLTLDYKYQAATKTTAYQSVSAIRDIFTNQDPDDAEMGRLTFNRNEVRDTGQYLNTDFGKPSFIETGDQQPLPTEVGTATHLVFQKLNIKLGKIEETAVRDEIGRLLKQHLIANQQIADQIDVEGIVEFYQTLLGQKILSEPDNLRREKPFSMLINAGDLFNELNNDDGQILIHGIIDGYLVTDKGIDLFDYKTDHLRSGDDKSKQQIINKYQGQVNLYAAALRQMTGQPVNHRYLYLVKTGELCEIR